MLRANIRLRSLRVNPKIHPLTPATFYVSKFYLPSCILPEAPDFAVPILGRQVTPWILSKPKLPQSLFQLYQEFFTRKCSSVNHKIIPLSIFLSLKVLSSVYFCNIPLSHIILSTLFWKCLKTFQWFSLLLSCFYEGVYLMQPKMKMIFQTKCLHLFSEECSYLSVV